MSFITNEPDRIIFHNTELADEVILSIESSLTEGYAEFTEQFDRPDKRTTILSDEDFYQGIHEISIIRRKSDGRLFGFEYFNYQCEDSNYEANGHDVLGDPDDPEWYNDDNYEEPYVFLPVEPFEIQAYRVIKENAND